MKDGVIRAEHSTAAEQWAPLTSNASFASALMGPPGGPIPQPAAVPPAPTPPVVVAAIPTPAWKRQALPTLLVLMGLGASSWYAFRALAGERRANAVLASAALLPVELTNQTVSVPAKSYRALPITLPYGGEVSFEVTVTKGKHVDVYVVDASDWPPSKSKLLVGDFPNYPALRGTRVARSNLSGRLSAGSYMIVVFNPTYGLLVDSSFDVDVRADLRP
jgi:hypothetical protein